jgi:hypothetical protein
VKAEDPDHKPTDDVTFDNEGPYWWDVGFAVPVKKISELKLDSTILVIAFSARSSP